MADNQDIAGSALDLTLTAIGSARELNLGRLGLPCLLICFGQETQAGIEDVESAARERYPKADQLLIGHVVDLHKIPGLLRKVAEGVLANEHKKAVESLPAGVSAHDYVVILPDWDGSAVRALGLEDATRTMGLALIDAAGRIAWRHQGLEPTEELRRRLAGEPL